jgi:co-chaperonin GroES (HSP10)
MKPLYNSVIVKAIKKTEEKEGNIYIPNIGKETNTIAEVIAVGKGNWTQTGVRIPPECKVGDTVMCPSSFTKFTHEKTEYLIGIENNLLAIL